MERDNVAIIETTAGKPITRGPNLSGMTARPLWDPHYLRLARSDCFGIAGFFPANAAGFPAMASRVYCPHHAVRSMVLRIGHIRGVQ